MIKKRLHELKKEIKAELDNNKETPAVPEPPEVEPPEVEPPEVEPPEESKPILGDDIVKIDYSKSWKEIREIEKHNERIKEERKRADEERKHADKLQDFEKQYQEKGYFQLKGNIKSLILGYVLLFGLAAAAMIFFGGSAGGPMGVHFTGERLTLEENLFDILSILAISLVIGTVMVLSSMKKIKVSKDTVQINKRTYDINKVSIGIEAHAGYTLLGMDKYERRSFFQKRDTDPVYMYIDRTKDGKKDKRYSLLKYDDYEIEAMLIIMKRIRE